MPNSPLGSKIFSEEALDGSHHFKWMSIRNFLCLAFTYCSQPTVFYLFNHTSNYPVTVFNYTAVALVIGMTYMCADLFIKQYTRRLDWNQNLSPVLKGITVASVLQSSLFCLLHIRYAGDGARYLASSFSGAPLWSVCTHSFNESRCLDSTYVVHHCEKKNMTERLPLNLTSAHLHYTSSLRSNSGRTLTWRFFVSAVIWILNFCVTTISDSVVLKFYNYVVYLNIISVVLTATFLAVSTAQPKQAFLKMMNINSNQSIYEAVHCASLVYGIGMIGVYDFGTTSPFTMIDNLVIIFTVLFIILCTVKTFIVNMLVMEVTNCVVVNTDAAKSWHYILFAILPLATEFLYGQKLINVFLYLHLLLSVFPFLMLNMITMTRLFHSEFPSVRVIYIEGLVCLLGFCFSLPILVVDKYVDNLRLGLINGQSAAMLYIGGLRMVIIMWVYGVDKFSTDINFWLGFSPTRFWTICWTIVPAFLLVGFGYQMFLISRLSSMVQSVALIWFIMSALIVFGLQTKTVVHYAMQNKLIGAFRCNKKYGPPDHRDRKRRRRYDVTIDHRECFHECLPVDEEVDCNHLPLMSTAEGQGNESESPPGNESENSLTQMFENEVTKSASVITVVGMKPGTKDKQA